MIVGSQYGQDTQHTALTRLLESYRDLQSRLRFRRQSMQEKCGGCLHEMALRHSMPCAGTQVRFQIKMGCRSLQADSTMESASIEHLGTVVLTCKHMKQDLFMCSRSEGCGR